jgi:pimeloyl-ACP methyl ester carboxylesterase
MKSDIKGTTRPTEGRVKVNGAELYYEVRGTGPSVLLVCGLAGDAGYYDALADILAANFAVATYDRRGYSRSPRPAGWNQTSIEEQADDAAALLSALGLAPAILFGSSAGGPIALDLTLRHPDKVRGLVLHEPSVYTVLPTEFVQVQFAGFTPPIEQAMKAGGPKAAQQTLLGALAGAGGFDSLATPEVRERWLSNAELVFGMEFPNMLLSYHPDEQAIARIKVPVLVLRAEESHPANVAAAEWLAAQTKTTLLECPGTHFVYCQEPQALADAIGPFLARVAASR